MTLTALSLFAAISLPFPAPQSIQLTDDLKCDQGQVIALNPDGSIVVQTPSGHATFHLESNAPVLGERGKVVETASELSVGQSVRVYYALVGESVDQGAFIREIDLQ